MSSLAKSDFLKISIDQEQITDTVDHFAVERFPLDDPRWRQLVAKLEKRWWRRLWKRRLLGWLPSDRRLPRFLRGGRTQDYVRQSYEETWSGRDWPDPASPYNPKKLVPVEMDGKGMKVLPGGLPRAHFLYMAEVVDQLQPRSVLEVGAGNGNTLFVLASLFPDIAWTGVELTNAGVDRAQKVQQLPEIPDGLVAYCPKKVSDDTAYRRITFQKGNAASLPFEDNSFDLVITRQALEQMDVIRHQAISEICRVSKQHVMFVEPFVDFNREGLRRDYTRAKELISLSVADLEASGIEILSVVDELPNTITMSVGLVVGGLPAASG